MHHRCECGMSSQKVEIENKNDTIMRFVAKFHLENESQRNHFDVSVNRNDSLSLSENRDNKYKMRTVKIHHFYLNDEPEPKHDAAGKKRETLLIGEKRIKFCL